MSTVLQAEPESRTSLPPFGADALEDRPATCAASAAMLEEACDLTAASAAGASPFPPLSAIPAELRPGAPLIQREYLVNGELRIWTGPTQTVLSPIRIQGPRHFTPCRGDFTPCPGDAAPRLGGLTPVKLGEYPMMNAAAAAEALEAAAVAYRGGLGEWPTMSSEARIACVENFLERMCAKRSEVIKLLVWEIAKTCADAAKEFDRTVDYVRESIKALRRMNAEGAVPVAEEGIVAATVRAPLGVVLCMGPFNYPLNESFTTLIPALLMGNTAVIKAPRYGVLLHRPLLEAFGESFPPGVVNTIYGDGREVVTPIISSGKVDVLAFIGSSRVADILMKQHPHPHKLPAVLGLGAKDPAVILPSADLRRAAAECARGALSYNGQRCTALKLIFVQRSVAEEFTAYLAQAVGDLKAGMPWEEGVAITPLTEDGKAEYLTGLIEDAALKGARIQNERGGSCLETLFTPAVLYPVTREMRIFHEEQFGPVIPVAPYDRPEEVLETLAGCEYGQQAAIFGEDAAEIAPWLAPLRNLTGRVNINSQCQRGPDRLPFGGRKSSALGTLSITDALKAFSLETVLAGRDRPFNRSVVGRAFREGVEKHPGAGGCP